MGFWKIEFLAVVFQIFLLIEPGFSSPNPNQISTSFAKNEIKESPEDVLYFGWFLNETTANSLERLTTEYLQLLLTQIPEVADFIGNASSNNNVTDPMTYFTKPLDPNTSEEDPYFHITAKFCGDPAINCSDYYELAKPSIGKKFETTLIGIYFTERTYGVRVLLSDEQAELFETDEDAKSAYKMASYSYRDSKNSDYPGIEFVPQEEDFHPPQSRAHVTLGCAPDVPAVVTGLDLLEILKYEDDAALNQTSYEDYLVENIGTLRQYVDGTNNSAKTSFVLYLDQKMVVEATFEPYFTASGSSPAVFTSSNIIVTTILLANYCMFYEL